MIGLARVMPAQIRSTFLCLMEGGKAQPFTQQLQKHGISIHPVAHNYPHLPAAIRETAAALRMLGCDVLLTHGYKADIIGWAAARLARIPVIMVSRGWTSTTWKVRLYEKLDRFVLRCADRVVCVSEGQARRVRRAGVRDARVRTICNAIDMDRFANVDPEAGMRLRALFPGPMRHVVMAVGRLSPEKGFDQLVKAAEIVCRQRHDVGFALIGDGPLAEPLRAQIACCGLAHRFVLAGFRDDVDQLLPHAACLVQSSHTEGMPNVVLEAMAAAIPVVATAVGGTPELVVDGETGWLVSPADPVTMATRIQMVLSDSIERASLGVSGRKRVEEHFSFVAQAQAYELLLAELARPEATVDYSAAVARA
jgi:glycosyltransferase involved in cell wall biosynthesis